jgi:hypothetical protein
MTASDVGAGVGVVLSEMDGVGAVEPPPLLPELLGVLLHAPKIANRLKLIRRRIDLRRVIAHLR